MHQFPWLSIIPFPEILYWKVHWPRGTLHWRSRCLFKMVNLTPRRGLISVGLGTGGMVMSPVLPIAMRNLSYHYQQKCAGKPIGNCFHCIDGSRCFEMLRRGGGDVTVRIHLGLSWVWGKGGVGCGADFHE